MEPTESSPAKTFDREQILKAERFRERKALLSTVLKDGKPYTIEDVERKIKAYMKRKVK